MPIACACLKQEPAISGVAPSINVAIVMAMNATPEHIPLADVKNRLFEVVDRLEREHGRVVITKHGRPAAVVMSLEDLEGLEGLSTFCPIRS